MRLCEASFREELRRAVLEGVAGLSRHAGWARPKGIHTAGSLLSHFSRRGRHEFATGGVRVCQVGVNPPRRAVAMAGVDVLEEPNDP